MGWLTMRCPNCGAAIPANKKFCEACGTQISYEMRREQEQINKLGCPQCGSSNVQFKRENQGEVQEKNAKRIIHTTVGLCKDCGFTWYPTKLEELKGFEEEPKKNNIILWILGWLFFFPIPVMVLIWRKKNTWNIKVKIAVTIVFWVLIYVLGSSGCGYDNSKAESTTSAISTETTTSAEKLESLSTETEKPIELEPIELNSLQSLFVSITPAMSREDVDKYIEENHFEKFAYTHDSGYLIGYESSAVRQRGRDRLGEMVEIDFYTSGDLEKLGTVKFAEYVIYTENSNNYGPKYEEGVFSLDRNICSSGDEAMQIFLSK